MLNTCLLEGCLDVERKVDELQKKGRRAVETVVADTLARWGWGGCQSRGAEPGWERVRQSQERPDRRRKLSIGRTRKMKAFAGQRGGG